MYAGVQRRFAEATKNYCLGALKQVEDQFNSQVPTVEEVIAIRRKSAGVSPLFALVEYVNHETE